MAGYSPLKITGMQTGLVQQREEFLLPDDAYPDLTNAYVWREKIKRKKGYQLLGRLQRNITSSTLINTILSGTEYNIFTQINRTGAITNISNANPGQVTTLAANHRIQNGQLVTITGVTGMTEVNGNTYTITVTGANTYTIGIDTTSYAAYIGGGTWTTNDFTSELFKTIVPGSVVITLPGAIVFTDQGNGTLTSATLGNSGVINYNTGNFTLTTTAAAGTSTIVFSYYPNLPVMGIRTRELQNSLNDQTIFFDQIYAYIFNTGSNAFEEFIPGTTWNAHNGDISATDFFWSTNYWVSSSLIPGTTNPFFTTNNVKLFWETNNTGQFGALADPPRITDGTTWYPFYNDNTPSLTPWAQIDSTTYLVNWLSMLPFRGRMVTFNTWEGTNATSAANYSNRIRWSTIGNPFIPYSAGPPATGSWRDDIRGQGGFLDIPTSEDIISIGFVRDNLVIYCERSTWQLRYTGRSIAPFQIEKVNSELGGEGPFSAIQFDTSLVGIGDKGIVECDSYQSSRMDIKIPDFVFDFQNANNGPFRVQGIRNFITRLAFWTVPILDNYDPRIDASQWIFPNRRLIYNYENDSWALFTDSLTALGNYQPQSTRTWVNTNIPWIRCDFAWINSLPAAIPSIVGGNQQGFVEFLDQLTTNDPSLFISNIVGNGIAGTPITGSATIITCPNHNMNTGFVIGISGIPSNTPYSNLNGGVFSIVVSDANSFALMIYDSQSQQFSTPQLDVPNGDYIGGGVIDIRDNFSIVSKKFNFLDEGQSIQMGYLDVLMNATAQNEPGAISLNVYLDYNENEASNTTPQNEINEYSPYPNPDTFFNSIIPTTSSTLNGKGGNKFWQRVYCATRANFLTLQYTFSNEQMAGEEQTKDVQIDAQVLWIRKAGRMTQI